MTTYDDREALHTLGMRTGTKTTGSELTKAGQLLLDALLGLDDRAGFSAKRHGDSGAVLVKPQGGEPVFVMASARGIVLDEFDALLQPTNKLVPLAFNAATKRLEGFQADTFIVNTPGEPTRKRPALAELVDAILANSRGA